MSTEKSSNIDLLRYERFKREVPLSLRLIAQFISVLFHPLFILGYAYLLLAFFNPFLFGEANTARIFVVGSKFGKGLWFMNILLFSCIIPLFGVFLMRMLGMVQSIALHTQDERKIPYVMTGIFYLAMVAQNSSNTSLPLEIKIFALGATIALFMAFFINLFSKISIHSVGMGGFLAMIIIIVGKGYYGGEYLLIFGILSCGLVGTARLIVGAHQSSDIFGGYIVGFFAQFIALRYLIDPSIISI
jgi:hypothetical protein